LGGCAARVLCVRPEGRRQVSDSFRGVRWSFEACGAAPIDVGVGISASSFERRGLNRVGLGVQLGWFSAAALLGLRLSPARGPRGHHRELASGWQATLRRHSRPSFSFEASAHWPGPSRSVRSRSSVLDRDPSSLGVRDLVAPPPTHPLRVHSQKPRVAPRLPSGRRHHPSSSRSVLVVSHHLDGFLRAKDRGLVASHCRSWGSPRFSKPSPLIPHSHDPKATR
jgi:hypothetical protein